MGGGGGSRVQSTSFPSPQPTIPHLLLLLLPIFLAGGMASTSSQPISSSSSASPLLHLLDSCLPPPSPHPFSTHREYPKRTWTPSSTLKFHIIRACIAVSFLGTLPHSSDPPSFLPPWHAPFLDLSSSPFPILPSFWVALPLRPPQKASSAHP